MSNAIRGRVQLLHSRKMRLKIKESISLNKNASIGCFGDPNQPAEETTDKCFVAGGGHTEYGGDHPEFIQSIRF